MGDQLLTRVGPYLKLQETMTVAPVLHSTVEPLERRLMASKAALTQSKPPNPYTILLPQGYSCYSILIILQLRDKGNQPPRKYYVKTVPSTARVPETISVVTSRTAPAPALRCQRRVNSSPKLSLRWLAA